ncbi:MAG: hypothetical protein D6729_09855 [Deltaproteobacteria bacterium]|nr:MAG: hypothetical protein D6729_09855 [Deltaproteobacteria bacterium]
MDGGLGQLFWLFIILASLQPVLRQRLIESQRLRLLRAFERARESRAILMVHRQEQMGFLGFPLVRYINIEDSEEVLRAIRSTPKDMAIDMVLHTPGGLVLAADQIARSLAAHPAKTTVFIPHYAMSGGTLIALAADEIVMDPHAVLGPVDPQLGTRPAASLVRVVEKKPVGELDDETLIQADVARMALAQMRETVTALLRRHFDDEAEVDKLADLLSQGHFTHDHAITAEQAQAWKLPVSTDFPDLLHDLLALYPQPPKRMPTVEYLPSPIDRRTTPGRPGQ